MVEENDNLALLKTKYDEKHHLHENFCNELTHQLKELLEQNGITLAIPIEKRVKKWESISRNAQKYQYELKSLKEIEDLVGIRIILIFKRDANKACEIIEETLDVLKKEDTQERLANDQFGYGSFHYKISPPKSWLTVPTLRPFKGLKAEIQIRTASQHIWAVASHDLQYKREEDVPKQLQRSINRVAALLELTDIEFERVLSSREDYIKKVHNKTIDTENETLNTDVLKEILFRMWPSDNADNETVENLSLLLEDLFAFEIKTQKNLENLIRKQQKEVLAKDRESVERQKLNKKESPSGCKLIRVEKGVFFTLVGLTRTALRSEFGKKFDDYRSSMRRKKEKGR